MTTQFLHSSWLADWRRFAHETPYLSDADKAHIGRAIRERESVVLARKRDRYNEMKAKRDATRNDEVIGACGRLVDELDAIGDLVEAGQLSVAEARARLRTIRQDHTRISALHDEVTCTCGDDGCAPTCTEYQLERIFDMSADDYEHEIRDRFPVLSQTATSLAAMLEQIGPPSSPGRPHPDYAPSAEELGIQPPSGLWA